MRLRLTRHRGRLAATLIVLLGASGVFIATAGGSFGASSACGCETETTPWVTFKRVGGEATEGAGGTCEFTAVGQKCQIKFKNVTTRTLAAKTHSLTGVNAASRYGVPSVGCTLNLGMGECTDELEVTRFEAGINNYCLLVEDRGTGEQRQFCAGLKM
jgi:hypothetical protein